MDPRTQLVDVIRSVRNQWRLRLATRGAVVVVAGTIFALLLSASGLESFRFSAPAIIAFRILSVAAFVALLLYGFVWPLRRRVSDGQVALYLEECDPTLEAAIISAVEATADGGSPDHSPRLVEKLVEQAIAQCRAAERGTAVDAAAVKRHVVALAGIVAVAALIVSFGPAYLRHGLSALLVISRSAEAASPYRIDVTPGNAKVPRGADQAIRARLVGFTAKDVGVMMRTSPGAPFERLPLIPATGNDAAGAFEGMLFHLDKQTEYYVESNGVHSPTFTLAVVDLPTVSQLDLEYRFPAYTGLPPRKVDDGGDVAAVRGTEVLLHITPTMATPGGRIVLSDGAALPLTTQGDGTLTGSFKVDRQGFYRIQLTGPHGEKVDASPQYTIDVIDDQPPSVRFSKPGRDTQATPVEELFLEARADDDYGIRSLQLSYSVNGGAPKTIGLFGALRQAQGGVSSSSPGGKPLTEVTAGHTIYLEELGLKPGDFVSYYAKATDNDVVQGPKTTTSDIYFVQVRPFRKDYKPAQSQAMGGGGGGDQVGELSRQQREIVAATFNIVRDKPKTKADKFRENVVFLNLAQAKLREQVDELVGKLKARLGVVDPAFNKIAEVLPKAVEEMRAAEGDLKALKPDNALSPEQRALKLLQEAEQQYEMQIAMQNGAGGAGGQSQYAEDLADLFELELDKLANQYEMQQRAMQQSGDHQIDELVEKLKELARRQQQEMERQRRLAQAGQNSSGGASANQRALADELEKAKRQLEQLTRDEQRQDLRDAMRRMQEAADAMRRAAANGSKDGGAQANQALDRLREALAETEVEGVTTNLAFLRWLVAHPALRAGETTTAFLVDHPPLSTPPERLPARPWRGAWRLNRPPPPPASPPDVDATSQTPGAATEQSVVTAPMPGTVIRLLVAEGERVQPRQPLLVLEAMKMETPLVSPYEAVVRAVHVAEGDRVAGGTVLVELEE
jgi:biotin carboxyl carrier protein